MNKDEMKQRTKQFAQRVIRQVRLNKMWIVERGKINPNFAFRNPNFLMEGVIRWKLPQRKM